uniref:Uncharacterized protein n=1 Tax=Timema genevievae TaxID=629358 RepID=A0A7R9PJG3_TIMGE|nr:unnamed protein product [Timema genevievae]
MNDSSIEEEKMVVALCIAADANEDEEETCGNVYLAMFHSSCTLSGGCHDCIRNGAQGVYHHVFSSDGALHFNKPLKHAILTTPASLHILNKLQLGYLHSLLQTMKAFPFLTPGHSDLESSTANCRECAKQGRALSPNSVLAAERKLGALSVMQHVVFLTHACARLSLISGYIHILEPRTRSTIAQLCRYPYTRTDRSFGHVVPYFGLTLVETRLYVARFTLSPDEFGKLHKLALAAHLNDLYVSDNEADSSKVVRLRLAPRWGVPRRIGVCCWNWELLIADPELEPPAANQPCIITPTHRCSSFFNKERYVDISASRDTFTFSSSWNSLIFSASLLLNESISLISTVLSSAPLALSSGSLKPILWDGGREGERCGVASQPTKVSLRTNKNGWITETVDGASYRAGSLP